MPTIDTELPDGAFQAVRITASVAQGGPRHRRIFDNAARIITAGLSLDDFEPWEGRYRELPRQWDRRANIPTGVNTIYATHRSNGNICYQEVFLSDGTGERRHWTEWRRIPASVPFENRRIRFTGDFYDRSYTFEEILPGEALNTFFVSRDEAMRAGIGREGIVAITHSETQAVGYCEIFHKDDPIPSSPRKIKRLRKRKPKPEKPWTAYDDARKNFALNIFNGVRRTRTRHLRPSKYSAVDNSILSPHSYSVAMELAMRANSKMLLGVELEVENEEEYDNSFINGRTVIDRHFLHQMVCVSDGSLRCGFEINTVPWDESEFKSNRHILWKFAADMRANGYNTRSGRCGLHVHVNTKFMNNDLWMNLQSCMNRYSDFWQTLSGRKGLQSSQGDPFYFCEFKSGNSKYRALSLYHSSTREFRFFVGTLDSNRLLRSIETCLLLSHWAKTTPSKWGLVNFIKWSEESKLYPKAAKWLRMEHGAWKAANPRGSKTFESLRNDIERLVYNADTCGRLSRGRWALRWGASTQDACRHSLPVYLNGFWSREHQRVAEGMVLSVASCARQAPDGGLPARITLTRSRPGWGRESRVIVSLE